MSYITTQLTVQIAIAASSIGSLRKLVLGPREGLNRAEKNGLNIRKSGIGVW